MSFLFLKRWLICAAVLCASLFLFQSARADGPISPDYFAIDEGGVVSEDSELMSLARAMGASQLRMALWWKSVEPSNTTPDRFNWRYVDAYFDRVFVPGMTPLVFVSENPSWAAPVSCGPIDTTNATMRAEYAQFMNALAARYPQIKVWILYNEADVSRVSGHTGGCFGDHATADINNNSVPDYAEYAEMAGIARDAVHAGNPNARVSLAVAFDDFDQTTCPPGYACWPASHFNYNFLPNLFGYMAAHPRANGEPYADMLTFTYYDIYGRYWEKQSTGVGKRGIQAKAAAIRQRMNDAGVNFQLFVTETGEDSQASWIGEEGQSRCLAINFVRGTAADLYSIVWWTFVDSPSRGWYYGLVDAEKNLKPSYQAYQTVYNQLSGWTYRKKWSRQTGVEGYKFSKDGQIKWVFWSDDAMPDGKAPCAYPRNLKRVTFTAKRVLVTDLYGVSKKIRDNRTNDLDPTVGRISFEVDGAPKYVTLYP